MFFLTSMSSLIHIYGMWFHIYSHRLDCSQCLPLLTSPWEERALSFFQHIHQTPTYTNTTRSYDLCMRSYSVLKHLSALWWLLFKRWNIFRHLYLLTQNHTADVCFIGYSALLVCGSVSVSGLLLNTVTKDTLLRARENLASLNEDYRLPLN